jgi:hypothetical protein
MYVEREINMKAEAMAYFKAKSQGCAMVQVVSCRPLTAEARVFARVSACGICSGKTGSLKGFIGLLQFSPVSIVSPWLSIIIYHMGNEE